MKMELIFWLNTNNNEIFYKFYSSTLFYEVGYTNQFGHIVLGIGCIKNKKLKLAENGWKILSIQSEDENTFKTKFIDKIISKLERLKK